MHIQGVPMTLTMGIYGDHFLIVSLPLIDKLQRVYQKRLCVSWAFQILVFLPCIKQLYIFLLNVHIRCLSVCLYPINVKTAQPIKPKFCAWPHMTPGKVYGWLKILKLKLQQNSVFIKFKKSTIFFIVLKYAYI